MARTEYNHITVGGTFDRLHAGHMSLLRKAFSLARHVTVAITADSYGRSAKKFKNTMLPYGQRRDDISALLKRHGWDSRASIVQLTDFYGPSITDATMDGIVVTRETKHHAVLINKERSRRSMKRLEIIVMPFLKSSDRKIIRSSRIRAGEIDRAGELYRSLFGSHVRTLPDSMRDSLRSPLGTVIPGKPDETRETARAAIRQIQRMDTPLVLSVGDIVTASLIKEGFTPHVAVIDYRNDRKRLPGDGHEGDRHYTNHAGSIMPEPVRHLARTIRETASTARTRTIVINGEEDLLAFPAILLAPLGSLVLYGQFNKGIVIVTVTEEIKNKVGEMLEAFS